MMSFLAQGGLTAKGIALHCIVGGPIFNALFCELGVAENPHFRSYLSINEYYIKRLYEEASQLIASDSKSDITINTDLLIS